MTIVMILTDLIGTTKTVPAPALSSTSVNDFDELKWCARYESNVRPSASEADALSN